MLYKNVASQKLAVFAYAGASGAPVTGDASNITCYLSADWGVASALTDTNPTELDSTNMPGWYVFDLTQEETNAEVLVFAPRSSTSGVLVDQVQVFTTNPNRLADHLLKRNMATSRASSDGDGSGRMPLQALALLRNKRGAAGSVLTIYQEDDSTPDWTAAVTTDAAGEPITDVDPT